MFTAQLSITTETEESTCPEKNSVLYNTDKKESSSTVHF